MKCHLTESLTWEENLGSTPSHTGYLLGGDIHIILSKEDRLPPGNYRMFARVRENDAPVGFMCLCINEPIQGADLEEAKKTSVHRTKELLRVHLDKHLLRCLTYLENLPLEKGVAE